MMLNNVPVHDGSMFFWHEGHGSVEASDFLKQIDAPVYDDACDVGFKVRSHKTGRTVLFTLSETLKTRDGEDTAGWVYTSRRERYAWDWADDEKTAEIRITVWND